MFGVGALTHPAAPAAGRTVPWPATADIYVARAASCVPLSDVIAHPAASLHSARPPTSSQNPSSKIAAETPDRHAPKLSASQRATAETVKRGITLGAATTSPEDKKTASITCVWPSRVVVLSSCPTVQRALPPMARACVSRLIFASWSCLSRRHSPRPPPALVSHLLPRLTRVTSRDKRCGCTRTWHLDSERVFVRKRPVHRTRAAIRASVLSGCGTTRLADCVARQIVTPRFARLNFTILIDSSMLSLSLPLPGWL